MNSLRALVNNPFKEIFMGNEKKKIINILTVFFIFHKSGIKIFLKWIINKCPKSTRSHDPLINNNLCGERERKETSLNSSIRVVKWKFNKLLIFYHE